MNITMSSWKRSKNKGNLILKLKDKKIRILSQNRTVNSNGFPVEKWEPVHKGKLWAYYRHLSGREFLAAATVNAKEDVIFIINNRTDIDTDMIVEYAGKYYQIKRIDNHEGYKTDLDLYCDSNPEQKLDISER